MKIVQTFWTKPIFENGVSRSFSRLSGGWLHRKYNYMSWLLSCYQLKKYYNDIELVTDQLGKKILIDILGLPYTHVVVDLDKYNHYSSDLWAIGKLHSYRIQTEPFLHVDGDVFIWDKFSEKTEEAALVAQNIEKENDTYRANYFAMKSKLKYIPEDIQKYRKMTSDVDCFNAGVFGGNDLSFFKSYTQEAFRFIEDNREVMDDIDVGFFNNIFEQYLFYCMVYNYNKTVYCIKENVDKVFTGFANFSAVPVQTFIHAVGTYKRKKYVNDMLAHRLLLDYPEQYYKITDYTRHNII